MISADPPPFKSPMRIGVVGAGGFIGGHVVRELIRRGHRVRVFGRDIGVLRRLGAQETVAIGEGDDDWRTLLAGLDGLVVSVGILSGPALEEAHAALPRRIAEAAAAIGLAHLVHVSAIGTAPDAPTHFLRSKAAGEAEILKARAPGWTIVRPSLVYGPGGTSMSALAALAALPLRPRIPSGPMRPIEVGDLARTIVGLVERDGALPDTIDAVGNERASFNDYVEALGRWLGVRPWLSLPVPATLLTAGAALAGLLRLPFGDRDSLAMLRQGADGDPAEASRLTGIRPVGLAEGLARHPATPAERRAAGIAPWLWCLRLALAVLWSGTGVVSLVHIDQGLALLARGGVDGPLAVLLVFGGAGWDIVLGVAMASTRLLSRVAMLQAATTVLYTALATLLVPALWLDPLGALLKTIPLLFATLLLAASTTR